ncbi:MAG: ABC transporter permease, partial [Acidobacteriota bacterium]
CPVHEYGDVSVTEGYFKTLGIPLLRGRVFEKTDRVLPAGSGNRIRPVVISEQLARRLWGREEATGKRLQWIRPGGSLCQVVGVVGEVRDLNLASNPPPMLYHNQETLTWPAMTIFIKTQSDIAGLAAAVREAVWAVDKALSVPDLWPLAC